MRLKDNLFSSVSRLRDDRSGVTALEFAIVCPVALTMILGIFCAGITGFIQMTLDDSLRDAARKVQMDTSASGSAAGFVAAVCSEFAAVSVNCTSTLTYSVQSATAANGFASITPAKLNASGSLNNVFFSGAPFAPDDDVVVQVAYPLPFKIPLIGSFATMTGTNSVMSTTTIHVEPYTQ